MQSPQNLETTQTVVKRSQETAAMNDTPLNQSVGDPQTLVDAEFAQKMIEQLARNVEQVANNLQIYAEIMSWTVGLAFAVMVGLVYLVFGKSRNEMRSDLE